MIRGGARNVCVCVGWGEWGAGVWKVWKVAKLTNNTFSSVENQRHL